MPLGPWESRILQMEKKMQYNHNHLTEMNLPNNEILYFDISITKFTSLGSLFVLSAYTKYLSFLYV